MHVTLFNSYSSKQTTRLHTYAYEQEAKPMETQGQLIAMEYLKESMLAELKNQISAQASVVEQRLQECEIELRKATNERETQGSYIDTLQQQLQKGEDQLAKATNERKKLSSDIGTLNRKLKTDEELEKTKWKELHRSMKEEVKREVTQHVDQLKTSIEKNENTLKTLPKNIKDAYGKKISEMEERVTKEVSKLEEQVKKSSQSTEENERRLMEMSSETDQKLKEKLLTEEVCYEFHCTCPFKYFHPNILWLVEEISMFSCCLISSLYHIVGKFGEVF